MLGMFISGPGQTFVASVFVDPIMAETGWSRTMISGIYTAGSLAAAPAMIVVGRLVDRLGARVMLSAVGILFGLAAFWMGQITHPLHLFAGYFLIRTLGQGSLTLIPTTLVAQWFVRRRGRVMAINSLGSAISQAVFPPLVFVLITSFGWRGAWVALGLIIWAVLLPPAAVLTRRTPESVGLRPDGAPPEPVHGTDSAVSPVRSPADDWTLREAMRTRAFWFLLLAGSSQSLISTALVFHHISLMGTRGIEPAVSTAVFAVIAPLSLAGTVLAGFLADRFPGRVLLAAGQAVLGAAMLWTFLIAEPWHAITYGVFLGLSGGYIMTLNAVIWPNYFGRRHLGSIRGVVTTSMVAFAALGPLPFGWLFDVTGGYATPVVAFLALPVASAAAALLARPPGRRVEA